MKEYICIYDDDDMQYIPSPYEEKTELVRCKDCMHRPKQIGEGTQGLDLEFPDWKCPCQCDDPWYNWMPEDDWYCGSGERKEECMSS